MKVVFTAAVMDLCHKGHINLLKRMRDEAGEDGRVIVILHEDKNIYETKGKIPIQDIQRRMKNVEITGLADIVMQTSDYNDLADKFENIIEMYFDSELVFMRGDDWHDFPASHVIRENQIPIKFVEYTEGISSSLMRNELEKL